MEASSRLPVQLSVVIPAHNESENLRWLVPNLSEILKKERISHEVIVVNDHSTDETTRVVEELCRSFPEVTMIHRKGEKGFGRTVREGFEAARGEVVIPFMGDASDDPLDVPKLYRKILEGYDIVYGSRFIKGGLVQGYPLLKWVANRLGNFLIRHLFHIPQKDITNAFKAFRREALVRLFPIEATEFNITLELAIKAHLADFRVAAVPVKWKGRTAGISNFTLKDLGRYYRDYLFTLLVMLGHAVKKGGPR